MKPIQLCFIALIVIALSTDAIKAAPIEDCDYTDDFDDFRNDWEEKMMDRAPPPPPPQKSNRRRKPDKPRWGEEDFEMERRPPRRGSYEDWNDRYYDRDYRRPDFSDRPDNQFDGTMDGGRRPGYRPRPPFPPPPPPPPPFPPRRYPGRRCWPSRGSYYDNFLKYLRHGIDLGFLQLLRKIVDYS